MFDTWTYTYNIDIEANPPDAGADVTHPSTIECIADATAPTTLPVVKDACDNNITPTGPVEAGTYTDCEGTKTFTYTYTDCSGLSDTWTYTYNIEYEDFTMPTDNGETIDCAADLYTPTPPTVNDNCSNQITPTGPVISNTPDCEGDVTYVWNYADCEGNNHNWTYTFTIEYEDFTMPTDNGETIDCAADLYTPTPPTVNDNCDNSITPTGPTISSTPDCEGDVTYVWNYADCEGNNHNWTYTFTIEYEDFTMPTDDGETIDCAADLYTPTPPTVNDNCSNQITPTGPVISNTPDCEGDVTYVWNYADCEGNNHDWTYTFTIEYEDFTMPYL